MAELLIKRADLHEGEWVVLPEFTINAGVIGMSPTESKPGVAVLLNSLQLVKAAPGTPEQLKTDAAVVNPKA